MSRRVLNDAQFDLLITNERDVERKRREDRSGVQTPKKKEEEEKKKPDEP
jgi:hypothetical protein